MKKIFILMALCVMLYACSIKKEEPKDDFLAIPEISEPEKPSRIKYVDSKIVKTNDESWTGYYFMIIDVDGHLYLSDPNSGGIVHMESCPCKSK